MLETAVTGTCDTPANKTKVPAYIELISSRKIIVSSRVSLWDAQNIWCFLKKVTL